MIRRFTFHVSTPSVPRTQALMKLRVVAVLALGVLATGHGQTLESLFDSSDADLKWPPNGKDFSGPVSTWPGQGERFGKSWPRRKVPTLTTFPEGVSFPKHFLQEYVSARKPLVFENLVHHMTPDIDLKVKAQLKSGWSAISLTQASTTEKQESVRLSLREVMLDVAEEKDNTYTRHFMPAPMKSMVQVPIFMLCHEMLEELFETRQNVQFLKSPLPFPLRQEYNHQLYCQVEGEKEFLLIDDTSFPGWSSMATRETPEVGRVGPFVNMYSVDYEKTPQLKDIPFLHIARLKAGDCLFVPAGFIHQQNVLGKVDNSFEIRWRKPRELSEADDAMCGGKKVGVEAQLGDFAWPGEGVPKPPERTTDRVRKSFKTMVPIVEKYLIRGNAIDVDEFIELLKKDRSITGEYPTWSEERTAVCREFFAVLDTDRDGKLSAADLKGLGSTDNIPAWCAHAGDKMRDFEEITFDLHIDHVGSFPTSDVLGDIEELIYKIQREELKAEGKWKEPPKEKKVEKEDHDDDEEEEEEEETTVEVAKDEL